MVMTLVSLLVAATVTVNGVTVTQTKNEAVSNAFTINPMYVAGPSHRRGSLRVINVYEVALPHGTRIVSATSPGYLPIELKLSDGRCLSLKADYDRTFVNTTMNTVVCSANQAATADKPPVAPRPGLHLIGRSWGFDAWQDDRRGMAYITNAEEDHSRVLFTTTMHPLSINAMRSPDTPGADMTLVGRLDGKQAIVTVELSF